MKRFLLFAGIHYEPFGGWKDYHSRHETQEAAMEAAQLLSDDPGQVNQWFHIVDLLGFLIVKEGDNEYSTEIKWKS